MNGAGKECLELFSLSLSRSDEDLQNFDSDETQPPSEDQRNDNETQDEFLLDQLDYQLSAIS
ncbi:hypothetical protein Syun_029016 [Stephania yunnanensis]|uniref:Uncharacterized protein n=1 Tax=Stephania yunnanensis TaxID=152371 RepID=A0AAP0HJ28_9MAGN